MSYFSLDNYSKNKVEVELDLSSYVTKSDTSQFAKKDDLANLTSDVDKLHIDKLEKVPSVLSSLKDKIGKQDISKLETTPIDLSKLSDTAKIMLKRLYMMNWLKNVNAVDISRLVLIIKSMIWKVKYPVLLA